MSKHDGYALQVIRRAYLREYVAFALLLIVPLRKRGKVSSNVARRLRLFFVQDQIDGGGPEVAKGVDEEAGEWSRCSERLLLTVCAVEVREEMRSSGKRIQLRARSFRNSTKARGPSSKTLTRLPFSLTLLSCSSLAPPTLLPSFHPSPLQPSEHTQQPPSPPFGPLTDRRTSSPLFSTRPSSLNNNHATPVKRRCTAQQPSSDLFIRLLGLR